MRMLRAIAPAVSMLLIVVGCSSSSTPASSIVPGLVSPGASLVIPSLAVPSLTLPSITIPSLPAGGNTGNVAPMPCDKLAPIVTQITGLSVATFDASPDDCSFNVNASGDSSSDGFGGIVDIRRESTTADDYDFTVTTFVAGGVDVPGVGDKARRNTSGTLMYAVHGGQLWAVQQELLVSNQDVVGNSSKLMLALFGLV